MFRRYLYPSPRNILVQQRAFNRGSIGWRRPIYGFDVKNMVKGPPVRGFPLRRLDLYPARSRVRLIRRFPSASRRYPRGALGRCRELDASSAVPKSMRREPSIYRRRVKSARPYSPNAQKPLALSRRRISRATARGCHPHEPHPFTKPSAIALAVACRGDALACRAGLTPRSQTRRA
jgi:hypothetical protein